MINRLFTIFTVSAILIVLFMFPTSISNVLLSLLMLLFSCLALFFSYSIINEQRSKTVANLKQTKQQALCFSLFSFCLTLLMFYFSYYLISQASNDVMCKFSPCSFGPYGWSVATLSFSCAILFITLTIIYLGKLKSILNDK